MQCLPDRDRAFLHFYDFLVNSTAKSTIFELIISFDVVGEILFGLFSQSETLSQFLVSNPEYFFYIIGNEALSNSKSRDDFYKEAREILDQTNNMDKKEYLLRHYRKREYLRIAVREIVGACPFEKIMLELSNLADALIDISIELAYLRLKKEPQKRGFSVIALGKLGNRELNFSSDIDLLFVHERTEMSEFYNRLASRVVSILSTNKEGGFVFRVDTRLRPGGSTYPLSMMPEEYEDYYYTFGQPWERLSLVKARVSGGDKALGEKFLKLIEPFVYPKSIDLNFIKEIRTLMFKIHKNFDSSDCLLPYEIQDIKKGRGGIREIEFILNYFQIIIGGKRGEFRHISTVRGLKLLEKEGVLKEGNRLAEIYLFFRRIEHKLQLKQEKQTQKLPCEKDGLEALALSLKMELDEFLDRYRKSTEFVHGVFRGIFIEEQGIPIFSSIDDIEGFLKEYGVKNGISAARGIEDSVKKLTAAGLKKDVIQSVFDLSFKLTIKLDLFEKVVVGLSKVNPHYVEAIAGSKKLLELFVKLLSVGFGERFSKNEALLDSLVSPKALEFESLTKEEKERIEFEIALKLLSGNYNHEDLRYTTDFAVRYIETVCREFDRDRRVGVIGYGKLATGELFFGSDLDVVFVCDRAPYEVEGSVVRIIKELKKLYDVDLRLRPYGDKGSLVVDLDYLRQYFQKDAAPWEKQAAQRSKVVYCGFGKERVERLYRDFIFKKPPERDEIYKMLKKIVENKGRELDIKSSWGCLTNIDFLVQAICFENGCIEYSKGTIALIDRVKILDNMEKERLKEAYIFFFKLLNALRLTGRSSKLDSGAINLLEFLLSEKEISDKVENYRKFVIELNERVFA